MASRQPLELDWLDSVPARTSGLRLAGSSDWRISLELTPLFPIFFIPSGTRASAFVDFLNRLNETFYPRTTGSLGCFVHKALRARQAGSAKLKTALEINGCVNGKRFAVAVVALRLGGDPSALQLRVNC